MPATGRSRAANLRAVSFLSTLLQILCVSYTILVAVFTAVQLLTGAVGPSGPDELLILFVMAFLVSLWNTLLTSSLRSAWLFLLRYAGGAAIVIATGVAWGGFIPLDFGTILIVCGIVGAVYAGTWVYLRLAADREAAEINRQLKARRSHGGKP